MKERTLEGFGERLAAFRQSRAMTQTQLGDAVGVSQRVIAYYETNGAQPPGALLAELARVLEVSADELLGLKPTKQTMSPKKARLRKRLEKIEQLPPSDQRAVLKFVDSLCNSRGVS